MSKLTLPEERIATVGLTDEQIQKILGVLHAELREKRCKYVPEAALQILKVRGIAKRLLAQLRRLTGAKDIIIKRVRADLTLTPQEAFARAAKGRRIFMDAKDGDVLSSMPELKEEEDDIFFFRPDGIGTTYNAKWKLLRRY